MKKRFTEEQIIGFLQEAEAGLLVRQRGACQGSDRGMAARIQRGTTEDRWVA